MTFIDTSKLPVIVRRPGWHGRYFNSPSMTFAHYEFEAGSTIHEHSHPQEEVWEIIDGELEITIGGVTQRAGPGFAAVVPPDTGHAVRAVTNGKVIVIDHPLRQTAPASDGPCVRRLDFRLKSSYFVLDASSLEAGRPRTCFRSRPVDF